MMELETGQVMQGGRVAARMLEFFAIHVTCDDLGERVVAPLMLQLIRERLVAATRQHAAEQAERAHQEILVMEEVREGLSWVASAVSRI